LSEIYDLAELGVHLNYSDDMANMCELQIFGTELRVEIMQNIETLTALNLLLMKTRKDDINASKIHDNLAEAYLVITRLSMLFGESHVAEALDLKIKRHAWLSQRKNG